MIDNYPREHIEEAAKIIAYLSVSYPQSLMINSDELVNTCQLFRGFPINVLLTVLMNADHPKYQPPDLYGRAFSDLFHMTLNPELYQCVMYAEEILGFYDPESMKNLKKIARNSGIERWFAKRWLKNDRPYALCFRINTEVVPYTRMFYSYSCDSPGKNRFLGCVRDPSDATKYKPVSSSKSKSDVVNHLPGNAYVIDLPIESEMERMAAMALMGMKSDDRIYGLHN